MAGISSVMKQRAAAEGREIRVIGVQSANIAPYPASLAAGKLVAVPTSPTIADGIAVARPGELNFDIIRHTVDEVVTVEDDETARAILMMMEGRSWSSNQLELWLPRRLLRAGSTPPAPPWRCCVEAISIR